ncbi:hypothetical protein MCOR25_003548 [Pyricularia grisea]|nr:hypothetical protein MCOR25_003548 [Pyricularia grisea]
MRSSTIILIPFFLFAGLGAADQGTDPEPDFQGSKTGGICCSANVVTDPSGYCSFLQLNSYCCGGYWDNRPKSKHIKGGCDSLPDFPAGRQVVAYPPNGGADCTTGTHHGFIGCVFR